MARARTTTSPWTTTGLAAFRRSVPQPSVRLLAHFGREPVVVVGSGSLKTIGRAVQTIDLLDLVDATSHVARDGVLVHGRRNDQHRPRGDARQDLVIIVGDSC